MLNLSIIICFANASSLAHCIANILRFIIVVIVPQPPPPPPPLAPSSFVSTMVYRRRNDQQPHGATLSNPIPATSTIVAARMKNDDDDDDDRTEALDVVDVAAGAASSGNNAVRSARAPYGRACNSYSRSRYSIIANAPVVAEASSAHVEASYARCRASHERRASNMTSVRAFDWCVSVPRSKVVRLRAESNSSAAAAAVVDDDDDVGDEETRDSYAAIAFSRIVDRGMDLAMLP